MQELQAFLPRFGFRVGGRDGGEVLLAILPEVDRTALPQHLRGHLDHPLEDRVELQGRVKQLGGSVQEDGVPPLSLKRRLDALASGQVPHHR